MAEKGLREIKKSLKVANDKKKTGHISFFFKGLTPLIAEINRYTLKCSYQNSANNFNYKLIDPQEQN